MARFEREQSEYIEKVIATNRVSKTVKGGRVMKFSALMVVGDGKGKVGYGLGKAAEVPEAIRKGIEDAKKNMIQVSLSGSTIPHEVIGEAGAGRVLMKPAAPGTGVIAGGPVRIIMEAAGVKDIRTKCLRSNTAVNVVAATFEGLKALRTPEEVARTRGKVIKFCKVQWSHHTEDEATWEREEDLRKNHYHLFSSQPEFRGRDSS